MSNVEIETFVLLEKFFIELTQDWFEENFEEGGFSTRSREGVFSPALTIWLMLLQRLEQRRSLSGALESLVAGHAKETLSLNKKSKKIRSNEISVNTGGFCKARQKLSLDKVISVSELINSELTKKDKDLWRGRKAYLIDGTTITLSRTQATLSEYPSNLCGDKDAHYPQLRCLCMHNLNNGIALNPCYGAYQGSAIKSEQALAKQMLAKHKEPSVVVGDRNFGIFSMVYHATTNNHEVLYRLKESHVSRLIGRPVGNKNFDQEVSWKPTKATCKSNPEIEEDFEIKGRVIRKEIIKKGFRPIVLFLFTTCPETVKQLVDLYGKRERIENDIRSLKYTLDMEMLYARSPEMIQKELLLGVVAYNLLRSSIASVARRIKIDARQISFSRAAELTKIFGFQLLNANDYKQRKEILARYIAAIAQSKLPKRKKQRIEPRKLVRRKQRYQVMKLDREKERENLTSSTKTKT